MVILGGVILIGFAVLSLRKVLRGLHPTFVGVEQILETLLCGVQANGFLKVYAHNAFCLRNPLLETDLSSFKEWFPLAKLKVIVVN